MPIKMKYTEKWPDIEPSLYKDNCTSNEVSELFSKMDWMSFSALSLKNKSGTEIFISGSFNDGFSAEYRYKKKCYITKEAPDLNEIQELCSLFADGKRKWKTYLNFEYFQNLDGTTSSEETTKEEIHIKGYYAQNITHGFVGRDYNEIDGILDLTNKAVVFTNRYDYYDAIMLDEIKSFEIGKHLLVNNVLIIYTTHNTYYKFVIKKGLRDDAKKIITKAIKDNKKSENKKKDNEDIAIKDSILHLSESVISISSMIKKYFVISNCSKCDATRFTINEVNPNGTGVQVVCENCDLRNWIKAITQKEDKSISLDLKILNRSFRIFNTIDPSNYYIFVNIAKQFDTFSKKDKALFNPILKKVKEANSLLEIESTDDIEVIETFDLVFDADDFNNEDICKAITDILSNGSKMGVSEIHNRLGTSDIDTLRIQCENLYIKREINRTENFRYYIQNDKNIKNDNKVAPSRSDYTELKELKMMLDEGLITQEDYDKKKNDILDL